MTASAREPAARLVRGSAGVPWLLCVAMATGCGPKVVEVGATPRFVCQGDTAVVRWSLSHRFLTSVTVTTNPSRAVRSGVRGDSARVPVSGGLVVTVHARRLWSQDSGRVQFVALPRDTSALVIFAVRDAQNDSLETSDSTPWDPQLRIRSIVNLTGWPVRLGHAGKTVLLQGTDSTTAFDSLPAGGAWESRMPMTHAGAGTRPTKASLRMQLVCHPGGAPA